MEELNFDQVETVASTVVYPQHQVLILVIACFVVWALCVGLTVRWGLGQDFKSTPQGQLRDFSPPLKIWTLMVSLGLMAVQFVAGIDAYVQTNVVYTSSAEYFDYLSYPRLLGTSHAHIFGYTVLYGCLAWLLCLSDAKRSLKAWCTAGMMWSSLFDVVSWWGTKVFGGLFHWLTAATGATCATGSLICCFWIVKSFKTTTATSTNKEG
jgi:hypothetical protein